MDMKIVRSAIQFAKKNNIKIVQLNGGEPTLHPDIVAISREIKEEGFSLELVTNFDLPSIVQELDGIADRIFISYYEQDFLPSQENFRSRLILRVILMKRYFPTLEELEAFLEKSKGCFSDFKITTLINNNEYSRSEQVDYLDYLETAYPLYEAENGKRYHNFMGYRIKRLDLENRRLDLSNTSFKVHVDGVISHYSEEDYYELGAMDQSSILAKELRLTRDPLRRTQIRKLFEDSKVDRNTGEQINLA